MFGENFFISVITMKNSKTVIFFFKYVKQYTYVHSHIDDIQRFTYILCLDIFILINIC